MGQSIQFIDIIFLGLVAGFLILRLRSVLGRRNGSETPPRDPYGLNRQQQDGESTTPAQAGAGGNVVDLSSRRPVTPVAPQAPVIPEGPAAEGLTRITMADPSFDPDSFLGGARRAFEMILTAFAAGDRATLRPLLSDAVYRNFEAAITDRESRGEQLTTEIDAMRGLSFVAASLTGDVASVTVRFETDQISVLRDRDGAVIDGSQTETVRLTDDWTFSRTLSSGDPNWALVTTATPEA